MAVEIIVEAKYMPHEGGTKFYEVIQFYNVAGGRFVCVNRWGKMGVAKSGGGETKIDNFFDVRKCQDAARKKVQEKRGRGYDETGGRAPKFGLNAIDKIDSDVLRLRLGEHYNDPDTIDAIMSGLAVDDVLTGVATPDENVVMELPDDEPPVVRDEDWGSW